MRLEQGATQSSSFNGKPTTVHSNRLFLLTDVEQLTSGSNQILALKAIGEGAARSLVKWTRPPCKWWKGCVFPSHHTGWRCRTSPPEA